MSNHHCLNDMKPGQTARIHSLTAAGSTRRRLSDLGLVDQTLVQCIGKSPSGDPCAYLIRGAVIAIRSAEGKKILIKLRIENSFLGLTSPVSENHSIQPNNYRNSRCIL